MLLGGPKAQVHVLSELHTALQNIVIGSPLFEAAITLSTQTELSNQMGHLEPTGAELLGIDNMTLLAVRPDGHIGLRSDGDHLAALERYRKLIMLSE